MKAKYLDMSRLSLFVFTIAASIVNSVWVIGHETKLRALEKRTAPKYVFTATIHSMDAIIPPQWIRTELRGREVRVIVEPIE